MFATKLQPKSGNGNQKLLKTPAKEFGSETRNVRTMLSLELIEELILQIKRYNIHVMMVRCSGQECQEDVDKQEMEKVGRG
jgi:hypothetical protein